MSAVVDTVAVGARCTDTLSSCLNVMKEFLRVLCSASQGAVPLPQHFAHSEAIDVCVCACLCTQLDPSCFVFSLCSLYFILAVTASWSCALLYVMKQINYVFLSGFFSVADWLCSCVDMSSEHICQVPLRCVLMKHSDSSYVSFLLSCCLTPNYLCSVMHSCFTRVDPLLLLSSSLNTGMDQQCPRWFLLLPGEPHQSQL